MDGGEVGAVMGGVEGELWEGKQGRNESGWG